MEEKNEKKKLNKKPLLICLAIALVFAIIGIVDINVNATESETYTANLRIGVHYYDEYGNSLVGYSPDLVTLTSSEPMYGFYWSSSNEPASYGTQEGLAYVISKGYINGNTSAPATKTINGVTYYVVGVHPTFGGADKLRTICLITGEGCKITRLSQDYAFNDFVSAFANNELDTVIDYDTLPIDDDMPVVSDIVRSYIINHYSSPGEEGITQPSDTYEYLTWVNTSDLPIQMEVVPVVQYYKTLFGKSEYLEEYVGDWRNYELLESGISKYLRQTDDASLLEKYNEDYQFKKTCLSERKVNIFSETAYFFYGYRVRYVDVKNEKAGPWMVVMPSETVNESEKWLEFSNGVIGNTSNSTGEISDTNYGDVDKNLEEIDETIKFKDKYDVIDGDVDTQEATNWLYSVVNFIKGTPQVVGSVLGFLPQPILYGMYVAIFLGVIASGLAIIKALF